VKFVLAGRPGTSMAGFEGRLTEDQLADLVAFLHLWNP
jgi:cytochrome c1